MEDLYRTGLRELTDQYILDKSPNRTIRAAQLAGRKPNTGWVATVHQEEIPQMILVDIDVLRG